MKRLGTILLAAAFAVFLLSLELFADEASEFQKKVRAQEKQLKAVRGAFTEKAKILNHLRSQLERMQNTDPKYRPLAVDYNKTLGDYQKLQSQMNQLKNQLQNEVSSFLSGNTKEAVEAVFKAFYRGSSYPDLAVEEAIISCLKRISNDSAIDFLIEELKSSKREKVKVLICEVLANKKEDKCSNALTGMLEDRSWEVVVAAAKALAQIRSKSAVEPMISAYERAEDKNDQGSMRGLKQALQDMTGEYMLDTARDFRNWWNGKGKESFNENETARPRGLIGKGGPKSTLYGEITSKKVVFICDVSHSMSARGKVPETTGDTNRGIDQNPETGGDVMGGRKSGNKEKEKMRLGRQGVKPGFVGMRIEILKIELAHVVISMLPDDSKFNLVTYSTEIKKWKSGLTKASKSNREAALGFVKSMEPRGTTNTYGSLETAFSDKNVDTVYFLSDGNPTAGATIDHGEILTAVKRWNQGRNVTIHTIGLLVGKYGNEDQSKLKKFLEDLASQNGGQCRIFEDK